jgi:hypothetical protein
MNSIMLEVNVTNKCNLNALSTQLANIAVAPKLSY